MKEYDFLMRNVVIIWSFLIYFENDPFTSESILTLLIILDGVDLVNLPLFIDYALF